MSASAPSFHVLVLAFLVLCATEGVNCCLVIPSSAAVVAGDDLSLTCMIQSTSEYVDSWKLGSDATAAPVLYQAPYSAQGGAINVERNVADGYLVNDSNPNVQVILTIVKVTTDQANYYYCICRGLTSSSAFAYASVLASEPTFSYPTETTDGQPVIFTCSVSFNGSANTSLTIEDSSGKSLNASSYDGTSKGLHSFSLNYNATADSKVYQEYFCNITLLSNDLTKAMIYSRKFNASVQWVSVRNVQITPMDGTQCKHGMQCSINQTIHCTAKGNPKPGTFQWMISVNESELRMTGTNGDNFTFTNTGRYEVQCIAFNEINGTRYNDSSSIFKAEVVMDQLNYLPSGEEDLDTNSKTSLIVGLVVGLGGGLIVIIVVVIVVFIFWKRKKRGTVCCNPDGNDTSNNQSVELNQTDTNSKSKDNGVKKNGHITPDVLNKGSDEVTVVDNHLYSGAQKAKQIDPSDGGYASINEVIPHGK